MDELKIDEIILKFNEVARFNCIKDHYESCSHQEIADSELAHMLLTSAMENYNFE